MYDELGTADTAQAATETPRRLLHELLSLAFVLALAMGAVLLERARLVGGAGIAVPFLLVIAGLWYTIHFRIKLSWFPAPRSSRLIPGLLAAILVFALLAFTKYVAPSDSGFRPGFWPIAHLVLLVPVAEEFYFRGLLLDHLRRGLGYVPAVLGCTFLFAVLHLPAGALLPMLVLGLVSCILALKGSLAYAVQFHIAWNAASQIQLIEEGAARWTWALIAVAAIIGLGIGALIKAGHGRSARTDASS